MVLRGVGCKISDLTLTLAMVSNTEHRSSAIKCYKSNDSFDKVERCFDIVAVCVEHVQCVSTLSKGRNFVRHCCQNGNIVEATFDFVEATFDFVATKSNVASTLLLVWIWFKAVLHYKTKLFHAEIQ